nr:immunoglobulin light chain junction region [Macaca mulatta]MPN83081.1 immunoglobulin light chain junction region [Macaca mulatta]
WLQYNSDPLTF